MFIGKLTEACLDMTTRTVKDHSQDVCSLFVDSYEQ